MPNNRCYFLSAHLLHQPFCARIKCLGVPWRRWECKWPSLLCMFLATILADNSSLTCTQCINYSRHSAQHATVNVVYSVNHTCMSE